MFIATLDEREAEARRQACAERQRGTWPGRRSTTAVVNPGGTRMAFLSEQSLTGYDNQQAAARRLRKRKKSDSRKRTRKRASRLYLYDAAGRKARRARRATPPVRARSALEPRPRPAVQDQPYAQYRPRNLLEDGTLFFDSSDALVPHASDGRQNVYEYEEGQVHRDLERRGRLRIVLPRRERQAAKKAQRVLRAPPTAADAGHRRQRRRLGRARRRRLPGSTRRRRRATTPTPANHPNRPSRRFSALPPAQPSQAPETAYRRPPRR